MYRLNKPLFTIPDGPADTYMSFVGKAYSDKNTDIAHSVQHSKHEPMKLFSATDFNLEIFRRISNNEPFTSKQAKTIVAHGAPDLTDTTATATATATATVAPTTSPDSDDDEYSVSDEGTDEEIEPTVAHTPKATLIRPVHAKPTAGKHTIFASPGETVATTGHVLFSSPEGTDSTTGESDITKPSDLTPQKLFDLTGYKLEELPTQLENADDGTEGLLRIVQILSDSGITVKVTKASTAKSVRKHIIKLFKKK